MSTLATRDGSKSFNKQLVSLTMTQKGFERMLRGLFDTGSIIDPNTNEQIWR